jgi:hypothetical protein
VCDLETSTEEAKSPLKGCGYKPTMDCDAEKGEKIKYMQVPTACANTVYRICKRTIQLKPNWKTEEERIIGEAKKRRESAKGHRPH